jgi:hypothetical protein
MAGTIGLACCQLEQSDKDEAAPGQACAKDGVVLVGEELAVCNLRSELRAVRRQIKLVRRSNRECSPPKAPGSGTNNLWQRHNELVTEIHRLGHMTTKFPGCWEEDF